MSAGQSLMYPFGSGVWPELLQALVVGLQNQDLTVIDLSMSCLVKLSEVFSHTD